MPREFHATASAPAGTRVAVIVSAYNETITGKLLAGAVETLRTGGVADSAIDIFWVPGAFELSLATAQAVRAGCYAAVIPLGAVLRGETSHDQHINRSVSTALTQLSIENLIPIPFGLLTCDTFDQGLQRAGGTHGNKGSECAEAALRMLQLQAQMKSATAQ